MKRKKIRLHFIEKYQFDVIKFDGKIRNFLPINSHIMSNILYRSDHRCSVPITEVERRNYSEKNWHFNTLKSNEFNSSRVKSKFANRESFRDSFHRRRRKIRIYKASTF